MAEYGQSPPLLICFDNASTSLGFNCGNASTWRAESKQRLNKGWEIFIVNDKRLCLMGVDIDGMETRDEKS